jgi:hypothetical protein
MKRKGILDWKDEFPKKAVFIVKARWGLFTPALDALRSSLGVRRSPCDIAVSTAVKWTTLTCPQLYASYTGRYKYPSPEERPELLILVKYEILVAGT